MFAFPAWTRKLMVRRRGDANLTRSHDHGTGFNLPTNLTPTPHPQLHLHPPDTIATSTLHNHAMEPILFAAVLMLFVTKFTALTAVTVYFINS
jgi:hypothetical protein